MGFDPIFKGVTLYVSIILEERPYLRDKRCWAVTVRHSGNSGWRTGL